MASIRHSSTRLDSSLCSISKLSSFHSRFHRRAEIMVVGREGSSSKSSPKALLKMEKRVTRKWPRLVARLRAKLKQARECLKKQNAEVKQKEIKCAEWRKWNEFLLKEHACIRHGVDLTLGILDAEDEGDFVRADHLRQSRSELVAKHMEETQDFFNGGLN